MTKKIKIPASIGAAEDRLVTLDGLATATGWERAAIVYAFTYESQGGRPPKGQNLTSSREDSCTIIGFSRLGINGLKSQDTVRVYRDAWKEAIANGEAVDIKPGDTVTLPTSDFPPTETGGTRGYNTPEGAKAIVQRIVAKHGAAALDEVEPEVIATQVSKPAVSEAIARNPEHRNSIRKGQERVIKAQQAASRMPAPREPDPQEAPPSPPAMTVLELQIEITQFMLYSSEAEELARKARGVFDQIERYLTPEQRGDLAEYAFSAREAWDMVHGFIASGGATNQALANLLREEEEKGHS